MYKLIYVIIVTIIFDKVSSTCDKTKEECKEEFGLISLVNDIEQNKPIEIAPGLKFQIEKVKNVSKDDDSARSGIEDNYFSTHAFNLDLGPMSLRLAKSDQQRDKMELAVYLQDNGNEGRKKKQAGMTLPLILGFKAAGTLVVAIIGVALLTFKALVIGKIALALAGSFILKKFFDGHSLKQKESHMNQHSQPMFASNYAYEMPTAYSSPTAYEGYSVGDHESLNSDLVNQYSALAEVGTLNETQLQAVAAAKRRDTITRKYVKSPHVKYHRPHIYSMRKVNKT